MTEAGWTFSKVDAASGTLTVATIQQAANYAIQSSAIFGTGYVSMGNWEFNPIRIWRRYRGIQKISFRTYNMYGINTEKVLFHWEL